MQSKVNQENIGCAIIVRNGEGKILLGKRKNSYKSGLYGFPGGRIDRDEKNNRCI